MNRNKAFRVISLVIVFCFVLSSTVFAVPGNGKNTWKHELKWNKSSEYMRDKGIMKGYGNGDFGFNDYVKRGDITVMIVRAFQFSTLLEDLENGFSDVPYDSYFYNAILFAKKHGIAKGDGKNFNPNKYVTIGEAIALIERSVIVANMNVKIAEDVDLHELYKDEDLDNYATRYDIAKMLYYVLTGDLFDEDNKDDDDDVVIVYKTNNDSKATFNGEDFKNAFDSFEDTDDENLDYVMFKLPSSSYGKLYYDYDAEEDDNTPVKSSNQYYYKPDSNSDRNISKVSFVPNKNYDGTFYIYYTAYDDDGDDYEGVIKVIVNDNTESMDRIKYETYMNTKLTFDYEDFKDVFDKASNEDFDYAKFVLPDEKYGKLYSDYSSSVLVSADKKYSYAEIDRMTFVPAKDYDGSVKINYIAYDDEENSYKGEIQIIVKDKALLLDVIKYSTFEDTKILFNHDEFKYVFEDETNNEFSHIKFELPDTRYGKLYYGYVSKSNYNDLIDDDIAYDYDDIDRITFVPATDYVGTVYIDYTAYDTHGVQYEGQIRITVK